MKQLRKKDRILVIVSLIIIVSIGSYYAWFFWPWFGGQRYSAESKLTDFSYYQTPEENTYSYDDLKLVNTTGLSKHFLLRCFQDIAIRIEFGVKTNRVQKWTVPVRLYLAGTPDETDLSIIGEICDLMNSIPGFPGIHRVDTEEEANFVFRLFDDADYDHWERGYLIKGSNGLTLYEFSEDRYRLVAVNSGVRNSLNREKKSAVIWEEMLQSMGMKNDTLLYRDTLFTNEDYDAPRATPFDVLLLRMLYLPQIQAGMPYMHCVPRILYYLQ